MYWGKSVSDEQRSQTRRLAAKSPKMVFKQALSVTQMSNDPERLTEFLMEHYGSG